MGDPIVVGSWTWHNTKPHLCKRGTRHYLPRPDLLRQKCFLAIVEIGFCRDLGCDIKFEKKNERYFPPLAALGRYWGRMQFIASPIGHAGTTLTRTLDQLTDAFSTVRPNVEISRASRGAANPATDHNVRTHDYNMFKSLLDSLTDLAQSRLLGIIRNKKRLVDALPGAPAELDTTEQTRMHP
jgi:hypothetical protein